MTQPITDMANWPEATLQPSTVPECPISDMGAAASVGWPYWPQTPVRVPVGPGGCPPGTVPAADRYGPICAGIGLGPLHYTEANAQFQPGPTRWGPPEHWCAPGTCPEGADTTFAVDTPASGCPEDCDQPCGQWLDPESPRRRPMFNPRWAGLGPAASPGARPGASGVRAVATRSPERLRRRNHAGHAAARGALAASAGLVGNVLAGPPGAIAGAAAGAALGSHLEGNPARRQPQSSFAARVGLAARARRRRAAV